MVVYTLKEALVWKMYMVFNATFNNNLVISWRSVLLVEETGVPSEKCRYTYTHEGQLVCQKCRYTYTHEGQLVCQKCRYSYTHEGQLVCQKCSR